MYRAASVSLSLVALAMGGATQLPVATPTPAPQIKQAVAPEAIPAPAPAGCNCGDRCDCDGLTEADVRRIVAEELAKREPKSILVPPVAKVEPEPELPPQVQVKVEPVSGNRRSAAELRLLITAKRPGGWRGPVYADVQPRALAKQHLQSDHGFVAGQLAGLSQNELLILHDLAHGRQVTPYRASVGPVVTVQAPAVQMQWPVTQQQSGCANGRCANPVQSAPTRRFRLFR